MTVAPVGHSYRRIGLATSVADEPSGASWWQTVPGVLTAAAALLSAVTALIVALRQGGPVPPAPVTPTAATAPAARLAEPAARRVPDEAAPAGPPVPARSGPADVGIAANGPTLTGLWRDQHGNAMLIEQSGGRHRLSGRGVSCTGALIRADGDVVLDGTRFETRFRTTAPSTGVCRGSLSPDGRTAVSLCTDSMCGDYQTTAVRQ